MAKTTTLVALFWCFLILVSHSATGSVAATQPDDFTLHDVSVGLRARATKYTGGHFKFSEVYYNTDSPTKFILAYEYDLYRSGHMLQYQRTPTLPGSKLATDHVAWNGKERTGYASRANAPPERRLSGSIAGSEPRIYGKWVEIIREELSEAKVPLSEAVDSATWKVLGTRKIGKYDAWGIKSAGPVGQRKEDVEIWVAPLYDFAPVEIVETTALPGGKTGHVRLSEVELSSYEGHWLIRDAKIFTLNPNISGAEQVAQFHLLDFDEQMPPNIDFTIKFPVGTHVFDEVHQIGFVAGKYVEVKGADQLLRRADISLFPQYQALTDNGSGLTDQEYRSTHWARGKVQTTLPSSDFVERPLPVATSHHSWGIAAIIFLCLIGSFFGWLYHGRRSKQGI